MIKSTRWCIALLMILCTTGTQDSLRSEPYKPVQSHNHHKSSGHDEHHHNKLTDPKLIEINRRYDEAWKRWQEQLFGLKIKEGAVVADIGAGEGDLALHVAGKVGPKGLVYANEIDTEKLSALSNKAAHRGISNIVPILGRDDDPFLPPGQVDVAVMVEVYHHLSHKKVFLENIRSRLKPGAQLVIIEPFAGQDGQDGEDTEGCYSDPARVRQELEEIGFRYKSIRSKDIAGLLVFFVLTATCPK